MRVHVDYWIESYDSSDTEDVRYAKFFLFLHRLPASMKIAFHKQINAYELYCTYGGETYRVTGASRLGDIWLHSDLSYTGSSYELRVDLAECSNWSSVRPGSRISDKGSSWLEYLISCDSPQQILSMYVEGDFDTIKREWPDAPDDFLHS